MNIDIWHSMRTYMDCSIELAILRSGPSFSAGPDYPVPKRVRELEEKIREAEGKVRCQIAAFDRFLVANGLTAQLKRCEFYTAEGDRCKLTKEHGGIHDVD